MNSDKYVVDGKQVDLLDEKWDVLVILDGCRYDIFKELYPDVLQYTGTLKQARTFSANSQEWLHNNFYGKDCSNIIYVQPAIRFHEFLPAQNFFKVVMTWETGWDSKYGTIPPQDTTDIALEWMKRYPKKRFIIHYEQPHDPFLSYDVPEKTQAFEITEHQKKITARDTILKYLNIFFSQERTWRLQKRFGLWIGTTGELWFKYGWEGIRKGYEENLKLALAHVNRLIEKYPTKRFTIAADHGELLGENGRFGHGGIKFKEVIEVP